MRKVRYILCAAALIVALTLTPAAVALAADGAGEVLYHQKFSDISSPEAAGIQKGLSGADGFSLDVCDDQLTINNYNDIKAYAVFPEISSGDDYTVVYSFRFTEVFKSNGYAGFMLTCMGDEPTNITSALIRADGTCGDFGELGAELQSHISNGNRITVTIPVEQGTLHEMKVTSGGVSETLILEKVVDIAKGGFGFVVRNASVGIDEIYIVNGVGYPRMTGTLAVRSTWTDEVPYSAAVGVTYGAFTDTEHDASAEKSESAPQTGDALTFDVMLICTALASAVILIPAARRRRYR